MDVLDLTAIVVGEILSALVLLGFRDYFDRVNQRLNENRKLVIEKADVSNVEIKANVQ